MTKKEKLEIYYRSVKGLLYTIYNSQVQSTKRRDVTPPTYTKEELLEWAILQNNFKELYDNWVNSDYNSNLKPSIDRLNDYEGYNLNNLQMLTWEDHKNKSYEDIKNRHNRKTCKPVIKIDAKTGKTIKEYDSIKQASDVNNITDINISRVCRGIRKTAGGFKWAYNNKIEQ